MEVVRRRLGDILEGMGEAGSGYEGLFFPEGESLSPDALCAVVPLDEFDAEASIRQVELAAGLVFVLDLDQVREVVFNARSQRVDVGEDKLVEALAHYYEHDAFLEII